MTEHEIDLVVGRKLRELRKSKNLSQAALGDKVGVSFQQIQKYENAVNRISVSRLINLSQALDISAILFFETLERKTNISTFDWVI